jgi:DnaK suppressor protein
MTTGLHDAAGVSPETLEQLGDRLEERFAIHTTRLTRLTMYGRLRRHAGLDPHRLEALAASARQDIADTAHALQRMSEGTYGLCDRCHRPIPLGRLRQMPHVTRCASCAAQRRTG